MPEGVSAGQALRVEGLDGGGCHGRLVGDEGERVGGQDAACDEGFEDVEAVGGGLVAVWVVGGAVDEVGDGAAGWTAAAHAQQGPEEAGFLVGDTGGGGGDGGEVVFELREERPVVDQVCEAFAREPGSLEEAVETGCEGGVVDGLDGVDVLGVVVRGGGDGRADLLVDVAEVVDVHVPHC